MIFLHNNVFSLIAFVKGIGIMDSRDHRGPYTILENFIS